MLYGICVNHDCPRFEYSVPAADGDRCTDCGQLLCHESGLTFKDAAEKSAREQGLTWEHVTPEDKEFLRETGIYPA